MNEDIVKICVNCGPISAKNAIFRKNRPGIECRACANKQQHARRVANLEARRKYDREYSRIERDSHTTKLSCALCKLTKPVSDFFKYMFKIRRPYCKLCCSQSSKRHNDKLSTKQRHKQHYNNKYKPIAQNARLIKLYGLTLEQYNEILKKQNSCCAICCVHSEKYLTKNGNLKYFCVDHSHSTGAIRGLLCVACNSGIGHFKDCTISLGNAVKYLENLSIIHENL